MECFDWSQPVDMRAVQVKLALLDVQKQIGDCWRHTDFVFDQWYAMLKLGQMEYWTWAPKALWQRSNAICRYLEYGDHLPESVPDITVSKRKWERLMGEWRVKYREMRAANMLATDLLESLH